MEIRKFTINDLDDVFELLNQLYENKLKITLPAPQDPIYQMHLQ